MATGSPREGSMRALILIGMIVGMLVAAGAEVLHLILPTLANSLAMRPEKWKLCGSAVDRYSAGIAVRTCSDLIDASRSSDAPAAQTLELRSALRSRGNAYLIKEDFDRAIADYDQVLRLDRSDAVAFHRRGMAFYRKRDYERAIADFDAAIRLDPQNARAFKDRGTAFGDQHDYEHAIADFSELIRLDANDALAFVARGLAFYRNKDYEHAIVDFDTAALLDPHDAGVLNDRGNAYLGKGDYDRAIADYDAAISRSRRDADPNLDVDAAGDNGEPAQVDV